MACGGGSGTDDVTITTLTAPQLIVARNDGDATWTTLAAAGSPTTFTFEPTGPYRVTAGCDEGNGFFSLWQFARTPGDDPEVAIPCGTPVADGLISTTMVQPGQVRLEDAIALSSTPNWAVELQTAPGDHDLVATSDTHVLVQRALAVTAGTPLVLPELDLATQGSALTPGALGAANATGDETLRATVFIEVGGAFGRVYSGAPEGALFAPADVPVDDQFATVSAARADGTSRFARKSLGAGATLTLPDPLGSASFTVAGNEVTAAWDREIAGDVSLFVFANSSDFSLIWFHDFEASERYAAELGTTATFELADIPNIPSAMLFDYATIEHERSLSIASVRETDATGVSASATFNLPPDALRPARRLPAKIARMR